MTSRFEYAQTMRRRGRWLCGLGWFAFAASLVLPAIIGISTQGYWCFNVSGWDCLDLTYRMAWAKIVGRGADGADWYLVGCAVPNTLLMVSPVWLWLNRVQPALLRTGSVGMSISALYASRFLVGGDLRSLGAGYYAWVISFTLVAAGCLHLAMRSDPAPPAVVVPAQRTMDEMAALREIYDFLHSGTQVAATSVEPSFTANAVAAGLGAAHEAVASLGSRQDGSM